MDLPSGFSSNLRPNLNEGDSSHHSPIQVPLPGLTRLLMVPRSSVSGHGEPVLTPTQEVGTEQPFFHPFTQLTHQLAHPLFSILYPEDKDCGFFLAVHVLLWKQRCDGMLLLFHQAASAGGGGGGGPTQALISRGQSSPTRCQQDDLPWTAAKGQVGLK